MSMSPYNLRADIKIPPKVIGRTKYPYGKMKVGDSFAVAPEELNRIRVTASLYGKEYQKRFAVRRVDPVSKTYRCWRIA